MQIKRKATQAYYKTKNRNGLPGWAPVFYVVAGIAGFLYLSFQLFKIDPVPEREDQPQIVQSIFDAAGGVQTGSTPTPGTGSVTFGTSPVGTVPANTVPVGPAPASTAPAAPPGAGTAGEGAGQMVTILDTNGAAVQVDSVALDAARGATVALFTGNFDGVIMARGVSVPALKALYPDPEVSDPRVVSNGDGTVVISFLVDPDRGGPASLRRIETAVSFEGGSWAWLGA